MPAIRVAGLRRRLLIDAFCGTYGQYRQDLLDPASALRKFAPQTVLFLLTAREALSMDVTESFQLLPEQSTAAIVVHHPAAKYYVVRAEGGRSESSARQQEPSGQRAIGTPA